MRAVPFVSCLLAAMIAVLPSVSFAGDQIASADPVETVTVEGLRVSHADYLLGSGDKIRVTVYGEDDLSGEFQVDGSGYVRLPLVGQMKAAGLSVESLEDNLTNALTGRYLKEPRVSIEVTTYRPFYIIGEVNKPGEYPYVDGMSALNAIAVAGGFTPRAIESVVYVRHENSTVEQRMPADQLTRIQPGDVVRVDDTVFWSFMTIFAPLYGMARYPY